MPRLAKFLFRFLVIVAAISLISLVSTPSGPRTGPYQSSLSNLSLGSVLAATHCENRACATDPVTLKFICVKSSGTTCAAYNSKGPIASKCIEDPC